VLVIEIAVEDAERLCDWIEDRLRKQPIDRDAPPLPAPERVRSRLSLRG
jgi:hypothetical protein